MSTDDNRKQAFANLYCYLLDIEPRGWDDCDWYNTGRGDDFVPRYAYLSRERDGGGEIAATFSDDRGYLLGDVSHDVHGPSIRYPIAILDLDHCTYERIQVNETIVIPRPYPTNYGEAYKD